MNKSSATKRFLSRAGWWVLGALLALFIWTGYQIYLYPMTANTVSQADYAVILGAQTYGPEPSPVFRQRILYGIELYRSARVKRLLFTGAPGDPPQAMVGKTLAVEQGVPETAILTETRSHTTFENLYHSRETLPEAGNASLLIVSDPLHLRRAMLMASDLGLQAHPAPTPLTQVRSPFQRFKFLLRETLAYWFYLARRNF